MLLVNLSTEVLFSSIKGYKSDEESQALYFPEEEIIIEETNE